MPSKPGVLFKSGIRQAVFLLALAFLCVALPAQAANQGQSEERRLRLLNLHTHEFLDVVYWRNGTYDREGLRRINRLMRDHRTGEVFSVDRRLLDQMYELSQRLNMTAADRFEIISGFRSARTQAMLASQSYTQGDVTYHMAGRAIDLRVPTIPLRRLYDAALALNAGGVGIYPSDDFIHIDRGDARTWVNTPYGPGEYPDGKAPPDDTLETVREVRVDPEGTIKRSSSVKELELKPAIIASTPDPIPVPQPKPAIPEIQEEETPLRAGPQMHAAIDPDRDEKNNDNNEQLNAARKTFAANPAMTPIPNSSSSSESPSRSQVLSGADKDPQSKWEVRPLPQSIPELEMDTDVQDFKALKK